MIFKSKPRLAKSLKYGSVKSHASPFAAKSIHVDPSGLPLFLNARKDHNLSDAWIQRQGDSTGGNHDKNGRDTAIFRQPSEPTQCVAPEEQPQQCTDPCAVVDKQAFAAHLIDAKNQLEAAGAGFGRVVDWTKISKEMAADLKGKGLQTHAQLEILNQSIMVSDLRFRQEEGPAGPDCRHTG